MSTSFTINGATLTCTGTQTVTTQVVNGNTYKVLQIKTASATFSISGGALSAEAVIVGGGGAGGSSTAASALGSFGSGGGGGGGVGVGTLYFRQTSTYTVTNGAGGVNGSTTSTYGYLTSITGPAVDETAYGGGFGGYANLYNGAMGGSAGGASGCMPKAIQTYGASGEVLPPVGLGGYGNKEFSGFKYYGNNSNVGSGTATGGMGGGGAGSASVSASSGGAGTNGGAGYFCPYTNAYYGGGGAGGSYNVATQATGGTGGGGNGGCSTNSYVGTAGTANTGGGGGGGGNGTIFGSGGVGGSGITILAFLMATSTVPSAPTINSVKGINNALFVDFTTPFNGGSIITTYYYSTNGTAGPWTNAKTLLSPLTICDVSNGSTYNVALYAVNAVGNSAASNVVSGTVTGTATFDLSSSLLSIYSHPGFVPVMSTCLSGGNYFFRYVGGAYSGQYYNFFNNASLTANITINNDTYFNYTDGPYLPNLQASSFRNSSVTIYFRHRLIWNYGDFQTIMYCAGGLLKPGLVNPLTYHDYNKTFTLTFTSSDITGFQPGIVYDYFISHEYLTSTTGTLTIYVYLTSTGALLGSKSCSYNPSTIYTNANTLTYAYEKSFTFGPTSFVPNIHVYYTWATLYSAVVMPQAYNSDMVTLVSAPSSYLFPPATPTLSTTTGDGQISLNYNYYDNGGPPVTSVAYSMDGVNYTFVSPPFSQKIVFTGLTNGRSYAFWLYLINKAGLVSAIVSTYSLLATYSCAIGTQNYNATNLAYTFATGNTLYVGTGTGTFTDGNFVGGAGVPTGAYLKAGYTAPCYLNSNVKIGDCAINGTFSYVTLYFYSAVVPSTVPDAPTNVVLQSVNGANTVNTANGTFSLSFTAPAFNGGAGITSYSYSINGGAYVNIGTVTSYTLPTTGLNYVSTLYTISVVATNKNGNSAAGVSNTTQLLSNPFNITMLLTPLNTKLYLTITGNTGGQSFLTNGKVSVFVNSGNQLTLWQYNGGSNLATPTVSNNIFTISYYMTTIGSSSALVNGTSYTIYAQIQSAYTNNSSSYTFMPYPTMSLPSPPTITSLTPFSNGLANNFTEGRNTRSQIQGYQYSMD